MLDTLPLLQQIKFPHIKRDHLETLQVNLGYMCNQQCIHCHVNASPNRTEIMTRETCDQILAYLAANPSIKNLDLTGGAPELNPNFRYLVTAAAKIGIHVIDRCNLTILLEQPDLAEFLAAQQVEIIASLPCYLEENVDKQRGKGVFQDSIKGLQILNALGYGKSDLILNLVFNPQGAELPPPQDSLNKDYTKFLWNNYKIVFNKIFTICNMPIQRYGSLLVSKKLFDGYMQLLLDAHSDANIETVMCRNLISIDWQGYVYDCDFNQMLNLPLQINSNTQQHISELTNVDLNGNPIVVAGHCYGCTAGQGSSCGGALS
ncbi:arsenosugar biosynthesis radical SAM (seleno)protein ArsS [Candidatus Marithrix sp. Canyon 246]|uniref:arsenosugar biosynthesis radical SAM (seleno)protein ArsS n=1 Tax=Candidatus Marithrix sp. Canyon 246 TaxID=1827136 RepID=UPI00084A2CE8|nr:arsenosugar biosynthesis radical SAM (seleno)protein ArsS [Candidatus Marithrix sp. Canyon 246]